MESKELNCKLEYSSFVDEVIEQVFVDLSDIGLDLLDYEEEELSKISNKAEKCILSHYEDYKSPSEVAMLIKQARIDELNKLLDPGDWGHSQFKGQPGSVFDGETVQFIELDEITERIEELKLQSPTQSERKG